MTTKLIAREEPATYKVLLETARAQSRALSDLLISDVAQLGPGSSGEFDYIDIGSVNNLTKQIEAPKRLPCSEAPSRARQRVRAGDVLVSMTRPNLNAVALVPRALDGATASTGFHVLRAGMGAQPDWLFYAVQSPQFVGAMSELVQGALYPAVRPKDIRAFSLIVPTNEAQRKIVAYLDEQLSRLDASVAALHRVQANLKRYRASVLKSACEGRLVPTEAELARKEGRNLESGAQLLQRVLVERRAHWRGKRAYEEPELADVAGLPELPSGWTWIPFGCLGVDPLNTVQTGPFGAQLHNTEFKETGVPVIAVGNLTGTGFRREGLYFVDDAKASQLSRYDVHAGDVLFARSGATLGKVCVAPHDVRDWRMTGHILRARLNMQFILPDIAVYALAALPSVRKQIFGNVRGVTRPGFNTGLLESIFVPLPPLAEQHRIVAEADRRLSLIRVAEAQVSANLARAHRLRQSILQAAFRTPAQARQ